jgi:FMN phosphatase YigB (HAD superfamily)
VEPVRVLLFDVFGTLVDWRSSLIGIAEAAAARAGRLTHLAEALGC